MNRTPHINRTLSCRIVDMLENAGLTPSLAALNFGDGASDIGHLVVSVLRHPQAWRSVIPELSIASGDYSWREIQEEFGKLLRISWRQTKDAPLHAERTIPGGFSISLLELESAELFNKGFRMQKAKAQSCGFTVLNAPTAALLLLSSARRNITFPSLAFRTSSRTKDGCRVCISSDTDGVRLVTGVPDNDSREEWGIMCARQAPLVK